MKIMLESISSNGAFEYEKLSQEEQQRRGILGRLVGVMADSKNPTRNGRKYSAELWEKVFNNPIMKEKIENRVCFGEACHPTDGREEVDPEKVAICLAEVPKINDKGQLIGVFDVLNTPCGRILKTMLDYGANIGVSSRGSGDVDVDFTGEESVNPDTYDCICWDAVFIPAVKEARLKLVTESLQGKTLKQALTESINSASNEDKKVIIETLKDMNIKLDEDTSFDYMMLSRLKSDCDYVLKTLKNQRKVYPDQFIDDNRLNDIEHGLWAKDIDKHIDYMLSIYDKLKEKPEWISRDDIENYRLQLHNYVDGIDEDCDKLAVDNTKAELKEMQRVLKENKELAITITSLQEKLSVSYAKEAKANEDLERYSKKLKSLVLESKRNKQLSNRFNELTEELTAVKNQLDIETKKTNRYKNISNNLRNQHEELLNKYNKETALVEQLKQNISGNEKRNTLLKENLNRNIADLENNLEIKQKEYSKKLSNANKLVENYKGIANKAVDKYIELQARMLGINFNEIKNKLSENYSFNEIDSVCEELRKYKLNISNLPFKTGSTLNEEMKIKPISNHKESILPATDSSDEVDDQLRALAGL